MFKQPETKPEPGAPKARNLNLDSLCKTQIVLFNGHNMITNVKSNDPAEFETHWTHIYCLVHKTIFLCF